MPKLRLTNQKRERILGYMATEYDRRHDKTERETLLASLVTQINSVLRERYPEKDMVVLRKYKLAHTDTCLKFAVLDTGRVFDIRFGYDFDFGNTPLADIPSRAGCMSSEAFPCNQALADTADAWIAMRDAAKKQRQEKVAAYSAFLDAAKSLEDVEAIVPLTPEFRASIGASASALAAINDDTLADIKRDFAKAA